MTHLFKTFYSESKSEIEFEELQTIKKIYEEIINWVDKKETKFLYKTTVDNERIAKTVIKALREDCPWQKFIYRKKVNHKCSHGCCDLNTHGYEIMAIDAEI